MTQTRRKALARVRDMIRYYEAQGYVLPKDDITKLSTKRLQRITGRQLKGMSSVTPASVLAKQEAQEEKYRKARQKREIARTLASMRGKGYRVPRSSELAYLITGKQADIATAVHEAVGGYITETGVTIPYEEWEEFLRLRKLSNKAARQLKERREPPVSALRFESIKEFRRYRERVERRASPTWRMERQQRAIDDYISTVSKLAVQTGWDRARQFLTYLQTHSREEVIQLMRWVAENPAIPTITGANLFYLDKWGTAGLQIIFEHIGIPWGEDTDWGEEYE